MDDSKKVPIPDTHGVLQLTVREGFAFALGDSVIRIKKINGKLARVTVIAPKSLEVTRFDPAILKFKSKDDQASES